MGEPDFYSDWPAGADCLIVHGFPGRPPPSGVSEDAFVYPETAADIEKVLREIGLQVAFEHPPEQRVEVGFKAAEWWIPVIILAKEVATSGAGDLLADALRTFLGVSFRKSTLHLRTGTRDEEGRVEWFEGHGPAADVLEAFREHHRAHD